MNHFVVNTSSQETRNNQKFGSLGLLVVKRGDAESGRTKAAIPKLEIEVRTNFKWPKTIGLSHAECQATMDSPRHPTRDPRAFGFCMAAATNSRLLLS